MSVGTASDPVVAGVAQLGLDRGEAVGVDVDQRDVPAVLGQHPGGHPADPGRATGPGDDGGALVGQAAGAMVEADVIGAPLWIGRSVEERGEDVADVGPVLGRSR